MEQLSLKKTQRPSPKDAFSSGRCSQNEQLPGKEPPKISCKPTIRLTMQEWGKNTSASLKEPRRIQAIAKVQDHDPLIMATTAKEKHVRTS